MCRPAALAGLVVLVLAGCGGDEAKKRAPGSDPALPGAPGDLALEALVDRLPTDGVAPDEVTDGVARTEIGLWLDEDATVGDVNDAIAAVDGTLVGMLAATPQLLVRIPDPGSLSALDAELATATRDGVLAHRARMPAQLSLPTGYSASDDTISDLDHQLPVHLPAAWNAEAALTASLDDAPTFVVADWFGSGVLDSDAYNFDIAVPLDFRSDGHVQHGHMVASLIGSRSHGGGSGTVGAIRDRTPLRAVDLAHDPSLVAIHLLTLHTVRATPGNVVMNLSLGYLCDSSADACTPDYAMGDGARWARLVRGVGTQSDLEPRLLMAAAAGNITATSGSYAPASSEYNAAALLPDLEDEDGNPVPHLRNTLVVENALGATTSPFGVECLGDSSFVEGNLSAIGRNVYFTTDAAGTMPKEDADGGTSAATPQAAAVAALVWRLRPDWTAPQVATHLMDTANAVNSTGVAGCSARDAQPLVDAYAAVLGTDRSLANAPVRRAILDVAGGATTFPPNGRFDEVDLQAFVDAFDTYTSRRDQGADVADFSRYDLNGDGFTGADYIDRHDLDVDGVYGTALTATLDDTEVEFDETWLSDLDVLCYYAWSDLYTGGPLSRTEVLAERCGVVTGTCGGGRATPGAVGTTTLTCRAMSDAMGPSCSDPGSGGWTSDSSASTTSLSATTTWDGVTGYPTAWAEADFPSGYAPYGSGTMRVQAQITISGDLGTEGIATGFFQIDSTDNFGLWDELGSVWRVGDPLPGQILYDEVWGFSGTGTEPLMLNAYVQAEGGARVTMTIGSVSLSSATCN